MKDRDPARVDDPFLIEKLTAELPGILLWMLEGLHRLLANRYQFTISERSRRNLEAAMEDGDNLSQFMQASAYVRFKPDTEERSTYLYRAYTKWCEDNLESPVPQKKFSQFLLKKCGEVWPDLFQAHRGKVRVCEAQRNNEVPSGDFKRPNGLAQQDGGALPRQVRVCERSAAMKAPVGLLSDRTVLRSKMEGLCPDKFCGFRGVCVHPAFAAA